jgi:hypothetical protein
VAKAINDLTCALKGARNTHGIQQIERLKMIDELLNKIPSNLAEMSDPSMNTTLPRVDDIRPGITSLTFQSPLQGDTLKPISEQAPRVQNKSKTTVSKKDKIKATNRERIKQNIQNKTMQRARIPQRHH